MASRAKYLVDWFKSPEGRAYFFSTHFWGPVANWGLPLAALSDMQRDESLISGVMSPTMAGYSTIFMAFAWQVRPRNYLLFACHATNATAQFIQTGRFVNYWYMGGKESRPEQIAEHAESTVLSAVKDAEIKSQKTLEAAKAHAAAGGEDALRRGREIAEEAKRELAVAKDFVAGKVSSAESEAHKAANVVEANAVQAEKKGWSLWGSAKSSASEAAGKLEKDAQASSSILKTDAEQIAAKAQADFDAAKAHAAAGGEDALRRGREIAEEAKRELAAAKDFVAGAVSSTETEARKAANTVEAEAVKAEKKGWSLWGSAKSTATAEASKLEKDAAASADVLKADAQRAAAKTQADLEAAKAHAAAGAEDALRRGREISDEAKRELAEARDYLPKVEAKVEVQPAKKGWFA